MEERVERLDKLYFDHAATSFPKPNLIKQAIINALDTVGNPARGAHDASLNALRILSLTRQKIANLFHVERPEYVVFTTNATAALNLAIHGITGHLVTTEAEHNSVLRPVYRHGNYSIVRVDAKGKLDLSKLEHAVRSDTQAIVITHASNVTGNIFDIMSVGEICRKKQLQFIVDASQTAGLIEIDMQAMGISALCASGHKSLYGPQGTGILCLSPGFFPSPLIIGGSGSDSFSKTPPLHMPDRLESGTQNAHGIAGLSAGIDYIQQIGNACYAEANFYAKHFSSAAERMGYLLYGDMKAEMRVPIVTLNHPWLDGAFFSEMLADVYGISVRSGIHCAPLIHKAMGTDQRGAVRFSFAHLNTQNEIDFAIETLKELLHV